IYHTSSSALAAKRISSFPHPSRSLIACFHKENLEDTLFKEAEYPLGIASEEMADMIRKALFLESIPGKIILYRGGEFAQSLYQRSLSYGTGLFAGCIKDPTATAFYYLRKPERSGFALTVERESFESPEERVFHIRFEPH